MLVSAIIAAIGAAIAAGSAIVSMLVANGRQDEAMKLVEEAYNQYGSVDVPALEKVAFERLGPSAYEKIVTSPQARDAQYTALAKMKEMVEGQGLTLEDESQLNRILNATGQAASSGSQALQENFAARGIGGGGAEIAAQLANQQNAANMANQSGLDLAAQAQKRYFDSIQQNFNAGSSLRQQDWNEQSQRASAADEIARFNADAATRERLYENQRRQQEYDNQRRENDSRIQKSRDMASLKAGQGTAEAQRIANVGQAAGEATYAMGNAWDEYSKGQGAVPVAGTDYDKKAWER